MASTPDSAARAHSVCDARTAEVLASQKLYYELRAPEYGSSAEPSDRAGRGRSAAEFAGRVIADLRPIGDVLEFACGPGPLFTSELARHAASVTAIDASPTTLRLNQARVASAKVTYVEADLFRWSPTRNYDFVFFGHWLSHIPSTSFDAFWKLVRQCTGDDGRFGFIDEDERAAWMDTDRPSEDDEVARRRLSDGRRFDIIKIFWSPDDLQARIRSLGWDVRIERVAERFIVGLGRPRVDD